MIEKIEINGIHTEVSEDLGKYVRKKVGKLYKYIPKHARQSVHADVKLKEGKTKQRVNCTCEVILHLPKEIITIKETTVNMFAAVDVVEEKLKNRLQKYKQKYSTGRLHHRILARIKRAV
ncbi:ribosome-associated translation inhibitor RaiA [Candidatus Saccharibacteria bacterium]|nr:ribosome-associated translation inhibitor RaiA [Candidatus Saccharibacteria bacterium]